MLKFAVPPERLEKTELSSSSGKSSENVTSLLELCTKVPGWECGNHSLDPHVEIESLNDSQFRFRLSDFRQQGSDPVLEVPYVNCYLVRVSLLHLVQRGKAWNARFPFILVVRPTRNMVCEYSTTSWCRSVYRRRVDVR